MWCKHQLGELAQNETAFRARGVAIYAISVDEPAASRSLADDYGIAYPILSDDGGAVSRQVVGLDAADVPLPGTLLIEGGEIRARWLGEGKADRPSTAALLARIDATWPPSGAVPAARRGYGALERLVVSAAAGGGALVRDGEVAPTGTAALSVGYPLARPLLVGARLSGEARESPLDLAAAITLRAPFWNATSALQLETSAGWSPFASTALHARARAGMWVALTPRFAIAADAGIGWRADVLELTATFAVSRLFALGGGD